MARVDDPTVARPSAPGTQTSLLEDATILGSRVRVVLGDAIQHARENLSLDGAPTVTLTLLDRDRQLIDNADLFQQQSVLTLGDRRYVLVQIDKQAGGVLVLTCEQWEVYVLRQRRTYRKAYRANIDRVTFARSLCRESGIKFYAPEHGPPPPKYQRTQDTGTGDAGFDAGVKLKIKSSPISQSQSAALTAAFGEAVRLTQKGYNDKIRDLILTGMVMCGIQESSWDPTLQEEHKSNHWGTFQQATNYYTRPEKGDPVAQAHEFLCGGHTWDEGTWKPKTDTPQKGSFLAVMRGFTGHVHTLGDMVESVQRAGLGGGKYDQWHAQAAAIVRTYHDPNWKGTRTRTLLHDKYEFSRGEPGSPETSWDALGKLAEQIGWRRFMVGDTVWFVSDEWLMQSRSVTTMSENDGIVDAITWTLDVGKARDECEVDVNDLWIYAPGVIVTVQGEGPADGKWLLAEWDRDLLSPSASVRLVKPGQTIPEPVGDQTGDGFKPKTDSSTSDNLPAGSKGDGLYRTPFATLHGTGPFTYAGTDQGTDWTGTGKLYLIGDALITNVEPQNSGSGWPGKAGNGTGALITYQLLGGVKQGNYIYLAENVDPVASLKVGQRLKAGTHYATARGGYPYLEIGWAVDGHGETLARSHGDKATNPPHYTSEGNDFYLFLQSIGGA